MKLTKFILDDFPEQKALQLANKWTNDQLDGFNGPHLRIPYKLNAEFSSTDVFNTVLLSAVEQSLIVINFAVGS